MARLSSREKCFECLARTGVYSPLLAEIRIRAPEGGFGTASLHFRESDVTRQVGVPCRDRTLAGLSLPIGREDFGTGRSSAYGGLPDRFALATDYRFFSACARIVNAVRGLTTSCGCRMPLFSTQCFSKRAVEPR